MTITGTSAVKMGLAQCLKGGVIMDVMNVEQARIAEQVGWFPWVSGRIHAPSPASSKIKCGVLARVKG